MAVYSKKSLTQLATLDPQLRRVFEHVLGMGYDHTIIEGHRGEQAQNAAYAAGVSKVKWPDGKHNAFPSKAVDAAPYTGGRLVDGRGKFDREMLSYFAGTVMGVAQSYGIQLRWGGDWDKDYDLADNDFDDLFHFELV